MYLKLLLWRGDTAVTVRGEVREQCGGQRGDELRLDGQLDEVGLVVVQKQQELDQRHRVVAQPAVRIRRHDLAVIKHGLS